VTVRTREAEVPSEFPPARLYLDDIEELVRILVETIESQKEERKATGEEAKIRVRLTTKNQVCDEVQELPSMGEKTYELLVEVKKQHWPPISLDFSRHSARVHFYSFTTEEQLSVFYKLAPIFKRRKLWLATLVHSSLLVTSLLLPVSFWVAAMALVSMLNKNTQWTRAALIGLPATLVFIVLASTAFHHSTIILRHYSKRSALRQEMVSKALPVVVGCVLTFIFTVWGMYLKHKYWP